MHDFFIQWANAALTSLGFFWMALWAFILGYAISSMIQVFVTRKRMKQAMGKSETKGVLLGTFFGFISSSCSFSALATTRSIFRKGAGFVPSLAFLLASTNLVIELGIVVAVFLSWQFVVGEYLGGLLLIAISWLLLKLIRPSKLIRKAREKMGTEKASHGKKPDALKRMKSLKGWQMVGRQYFMEWDMVWKDVSIGFTLAGVIAAFVPGSFFEALFIHSGPGKTQYSFITLVEHSMIGPLAAFFTFIGSMGNIPLASLLYVNGVSFAGVMAFIFSDLVVFPVLRINARYYGWRMSLFIALILYISLVITSLLLHYTIDLSGMLPGGGTVSAATQQHFKLDYTFVLNILFILVSLVFAWLVYRKKGHKHGHHHAQRMADRGVTGLILRYLAYIAFIWMSGGLVVHFFIL